MVAAHSVALPAVATVTAAALTVASVTVAPTRVAALTVASVTVAPYTYSTANTHCRAVPHFYSNQTLQTGLNQEAKRKVLSRSKS